jgi:hypothetical protein
MTSNGRPVGVLTHANENSLEDVLALLRAGRAQRAVLEMRRATLARGLNKWSERSRRWFVKHAKESVEWLPEISVEDRRGHQRTGLCSDPAGRNTRPHFSTLY